MNEYTIVALIAGIAIGWVVSRFISRSATSTKEQLLKALDKASAAVAAMNDPGPDEQVAIAARMKREEILQASIASNMSKIVKA